MSSSNITLVWRIGSKFSEDSLAQIFEESGSTEQEPKGEHEKRIWKFNDLTIKLYDRTLVVQGKLSSAGLLLLEGINLIEGLSLEYQVDVFLESNISFGSTHPSIQI